MAARHGDSGPDISFAFTHEPSAARAARDAVSALTDDGCPRAEDVGLVVSELVSNVVLHTADGGRLDAWNSDPIRLEVHDGDPHLPVSPPVAGDTGGRGLRIVAGVADRWGADPDATGKVVWAELWR